VRERQTRQLDATYAVVHAAHDHPTAEHVHERVQQRLKRISLGTVYRNLQKLVAQGRVRVVRIGPRSARFDAMLEPHEHFMCEICDEITDLSSAVAVPIRRTSLRRRGYNVTGQTTTFFGTCPRCARATRSN